MRATRHEAAVSDDGAGSASGLGWLRRQAGLLNRVDLVVGLLLTAFAVLLGTSLADPRSTVLALGLPLVALPVIWRRRAPLACLMVSSTAVAVTALPHDQIRCGVAIPSALLILYTLAVREDRRAALQGLGVALAALILLDATDPQLLGVATGTLLAALYLLVWAAGRLVGSRGRIAAQLTERSIALDSQREQTAQMAIDVERTRLAADLDASARGRLSEMVELAGSAELAAADDPAVARAAFARIEASGRASLNEMRGLLGVLRSDEAGTRAPGPTLAELDSLLAEARAGGRVVELSVEGARRPLPSGLELAAYRIVQHALAAGDGSPADVRLRYTADALELEMTGPSVVVDDRPDVALLAVRERVAAYGGSFAMRDDESGRTMLRARLPVAIAHG